jgi:tetratricopeptide (TPR) repeat protein
VIYSTFCGFVRLTKIKAMPYPVNQHAVRMPKCAGHAVVLRNPGKAIRFWTAGKQYIFCLSLLLSCFISFGPDADAQDKEDSPIDSVKELLFAKGMVGFTGAVADRGGEYNNRNDLAFFFQCDKMISRELKITRKPSIEVLIYRNMVYTGIADAYLGLNKLDSAIAYYTAAEQIFNDQFRQSFIAASKKEEPGKAPGYYSKNADREINGYKLMLYPHKGLCYLGQNQLTLALAYFRKSLALARNEHDDDVRFEVMENMGKLFREAAKEDSALFYFRKALLIKDRGAVSQAYIYHLMGDSYLTGHGLPIDQCIPLYRKARALVSGLYLYTDPLGGGSGLKAPYPENEESNNTIGEGDWDPASLYRFNIDEIFAGGTKIWLAKAKKSSGTATYIDSAFQYGEFGRALGLERLIKTINEQQHYKYAGGAIVNYDVALHKSPQEPINILTAVKQLEYPVVTYRVLEDLLLIFCAAPGKPVCLYEAPIGRSALLKLIMDFRASLGVADDLRGVAKKSPKEIHADQDFGSTLGDLLLPESILQQLGDHKEIIIVPQAFIGLVPFPIIKAAGKPVVERYAVRIAPSIFSLHQIGERPFIAFDDKQARSLVAAVDAARKIDLEDEEIDLPQLKYAVQEGNDVAKILGTKLLKAPELKLDTAFDTLLGAAPVIHLVAHGIAFTDLGKEFHSFLAFPADSDHSSELSIRYIIHNQTPVLKADLVFLSACESGVGSLSNMEGVLGLQRAFLAKGARTVISTLWSISDSESVYLVDQFYIHLTGDADKPSKAEALRRAQLDARAVNEDPFYWAGFQVIGAK